jgi:hypothetical protein
VPLFYDMHIMGVGVGIAVETKKSQASQQKGSKNHTVEWKLVELDLPRAAWRSFAPQPLANGEKKVACHLNGDPCHLAGLWPPLRLFVLSAVPSRRLGHQGSLVYCGHCSVS